MAKILFINPVVREEDVPRHIPYGMAILAEIARKSGHAVQVYDANAWRKGFNIVKQVLEADHWDVVAIGGLTTTYNFIKEVCRLAKIHAADSFLIAGGGFLTSMPKEIMDWVPQIDLGIIGEAYITFPEVLAKVDNKDFDWGNTLGVVHRDNGKITVNKERPNISDIDTIPWPAWDLFPLEEIYLKNSSSLFSEEAYYAKRRIDVNASYGCNLVCRYCWHLGTTGDMIVREDPTGENDVAFTYGRNIRYHSPDYIVSLVKHLKGEYGIDFVNFLDENLMTMDRYSKMTWLDELCRKWIEGGLQPDCRRLNVPFDQVENHGVFWSGTSHAALHRPEILKKMYEAGCTHLVYGLESFDKRILKKLGKGSTSEKNEQSISICLESGIKPIPNIIIGFPEEDFKSLRNTIESLVKLGIHAKPHFATAYPGSEWYYTYKDSIIEQYDGNLERYIMDLGDATKITATICHKFSGMELLGLQEIVAKKDLRLLDLAEKHWNKSDESIKPYAIPKPSHNFIAEKISAPMLKNLK
ncbi:MAG: B12-binding domain-containing radical SAM protein [Gammaproteobacteria bacterium]|nr:B12-binding domain-containing radical SAM protein [Gammaproteobacteria bacterium]